jgi:hypothetical protein
LWDGEAVGFGRLPRFERKDHTMFYTMFYSHGTRFDAYHDTLSEARSWLKQMEIAKAKPLSLLDKIVVRYGRKMIDDREYI